ncbi:g-strand binding protein [Cystobasidiomycetes sp. EMM_F5]
MQVETMSGQGQGQEAARRTQEGFPQRATGSAVGRGHAAETARLEDALAAEVRETVGITGTGTATATDAMTIGTVETMRSTRERQLGADTGEGGHPGVHLKKENRVYIGNLSFQVRWHDLKDFCSAAGTVVFSEIIQLPNGMSKGCGIVEYSTNEEAQRAIRELNEGQLFGRPAFLREDREDEARFGAAAVSGRTTFPGASHQSGGGGGHRGRSEVGVPAVFAPPGPRGLFVTGMTPEIGWQDLKDLFRRAGEVQRADINMDHSTNTSKGTGVVVMSSRAEADEAIAMFNGYEFEGGRLEVREDRFFHINQARSALGPPRGGRPSGRGGFSGSHASSRSTDNLYNDYAGPSDSMSSRCGGDDFGSGSERLSYSGFSGRAPPTGPYAGRDPIQASPSTQIFVNNLPWSTSNEDLVELFQTTGTVEEAEIIWEGGRSKGNGIVQFATIDEAETAIAKFQGYQYGGRPLRLAFNARWKDFKEGGSRALKDEQATAVGENGADNYDMGDNVGPADYDTYKEVVPADEAMQA